MVYIQSEIKRGFLRQIAQGAITTGNTLRDSLYAFQAQIWTDSFKRGRIIISQSGSGQSGSFSIPQTGDQYRPDQIFAMSEMLIQLLEDYVSSGTGDGTDKATIDTLFTAMINDPIMSSVRTAGIDVTLIGIRNQWGNAS